MRRFAIPALLLAGSAALAAEPRLPPARGVYLPADIPCARATGAALRHFDGHGFAHAGTACVTRGLMSDGPGFRFTETCLRLSTGVETEASVHLAPEGEAAFTRDGVRYRRCAPAELPPRPAGRLRCRRRPCAPGAPEPMAGRRCSSCVNCRSPCRAPTR